MIPQEVISHKGTVVSAGPTATVVRLLAQDACGHCEAASLCGMSTVAEKLVEVPTRLNHPHAVGDEVEVLLKGSMGIKAVWIAYMIPLLVLLAVILGLYALGVGEVAAGLSGIGAVAVYYLVIWLLRARLRNEYVFTIKE